MADKTDKKPRHKFFALRISEEGYRLFQQLSAHVNTHGWSSIGVTTGELLTKTNLAAHAVRLLAVKAKLPVKPAAKK